MKKTKRTALIWTLSLATCLAIIIGVCAVYVGDYYRADIEAISKFTDNHSVKQNEVSDGVLVFEPDGANIGFIFYPGGKVEYTAYIPLMSTLAEEGVLCILLEMPFNLAVLDMNAADGLTDDYPEIEEWYIGGHSLGGSMAASHLAKNTANFDGLILLGSYSTAEITLPVLSVYGSEDNVLNREKYAEYKPNISGSLTEFVIDGGCHAYFGMYGNQDGDGVPSISVDEQISITVNEIINFIN